MNLSRPAFACVAAACFATSGFAAVRVDDAGTVVSPPIASLQWATARTGGAPSAADFNVALRLNMGPFVGKPVRVWMNLNSTGPVPAQVAARWPTRGLFLGGMVREGNRVLVFDGIPGRSVLEELVPFRIEANPDRIDRIQTLRFDFEAEPR